MNSCTWISPIRASLCVDAVQPTLQRLLGLCGVAAAEFVQREGDRPAERVAPEEAVEPVAGADAEEVAPRVVEHAPAADLEVHLIALRRALHPQRRLEPIKPVGPHRRRGRADAA